MSAFESRDKASLTLCRVRALVDLIAAVNVDNLEPCTMQTVALHLWELVGEAKELVDDEWKIAPKAGAA